MNIETPKTTNTKEEKLERIKDLIIKNEDFPRTRYTEASEIKPYVLEFENGNKKLVYFGSPHTNNPKDPVFEEIKEKFEEVKPDMVYIEGWWKINEWKDKARELMQKETLEGVKTKGEAHYTLKLAVDSGADFESPEPGFKAEIKDQLEKGFSKRDIFSYYIYRIIDQYQRQDEEVNTEDCKKYLEKYFERFEEDTEWSQEELKKLEQEVLKDLNVNDRKKYNEQVNPIPWEVSSETMVNKVSRNSSSFRDRYALERIAEGLKKYDKVFVVFGASHAVKMEPALRALMAEEK